MRTWVALLTLALASPVVAHPCPDAKPTPKATTTRTKKSATPTAEQVVALYKRVGHALAALPHDNAQSLFMRYRRINIVDALRTPTKRSEAMTTLDKINADVKKLP